MEKLPVPSSETAAAAAEVATQFRSLVSAEDVGSIKQAQHLIFLPYIVTFLGNDTNVYFRENASESSTWSNLAKDIRLACTTLIDILGRLQDSNAVLTHFNEYAEQCFTEVSSDFASKTRLLKSMKDDLDHIFMKLRSMKSRLVATYPDAFPDGAMSKTMDQRPDLERPLE